MASVTPYYNGGAGYIGYVGGAKTARFKFTTGTDGAKKLEFQTSYFWLQEPQDNSGYATAGHFRCAISTSATAYNGYAGSAGKAIIQYSAGDPGYMQCSITQNLLPNTTYYLFIFPDSKNLYCNWYIKGLTGNAVTLSGVYAQATTVSASDGVFGEAVEITLNRHSEGYTHTVKVAVGDIPDTEIYTKTSDYPTLSWTPVLSQYASAITDKGSVPTTITVETYNGNSLIGSDSTTIQLSFPADQVGPVAGNGWYSAAPYNQDKGSAVAAYLAGISKVRVTFDSSKITLRENATLSALAIICGGETIEADLTASPVQADSPILNGATAITIRATDSRGFTAEETLNVTPNPYAAPVVTNVNVVRCDENGTPNANGSYLSIQASASCSSAGGENRITSLKFWARQLGQQYAGNGTALGLLPVILVQPVDLDTVTKNPVYFKVTARGENLSYRWQYRTSEAGNWTNSTTASATTERLAVSARPAISGYQYRCRVSNDAGTVYTDVVTLTVSSEGADPVTPVIPVSHVTETAVRIEGGFNPDISFELKFEVTDTAGNSSITLLRVPTRKWALKFGTGANSVGLGKAPEHDNALELPDTWSIYFGSQSWLDKVYPVGSIYMSANSTSPATLFGGSWSPIEGKFLLAAGNGYTAGDSGGLASHSFNDDAQAAIGLYKSGNNAYVEIDDDDGEGGSRNFTGYTKYASLSGYNDTPDASYVTPSAAKVTGSVDTMPPYLTVYVWQRTA